MIRQDMDSGLDMAAFKAVLDQHAIVVVTNVEGHVTYANTLFCELTGYDPEELEGRSLGVLNSGKNPKGYFADLWNTLKSGQTWRGDICNNDKSGRLFWVDTTIAPVLDAGGQASAYVALYYDITQRRHGERHLRESRERFKSLLAMSSDWYWESDRDCNITLLSEGIDLTGINRLTLIGKPLWAIDAEDRDQIWPEQKTLLKAMRPFNNFEFRVSHPVTPGSRLWLSISGQPMYDNAGLFIGYRGVGRDITSRRSAQERLWELANLDGLTGLPNRMHFNSALENSIAEARVNGRPFALAIIDLDNFKEVNDTMGHDVGDELLMAVAKRLRAALRQSDLIARLGGDEFGVLIHEIESGGMLTRPLDAMMKAMSTPVEIGGQLNRCGMSIGVTLFPSDAIEPASLIKNADIALYRAKAAGRGQYVLFQPDLKTEVERRASVAQEMEDALTAGLLRLHYQPVVDVELGAVVSFEALLRWHHPTRGLVSVGLFPQVFDNYGLAAQIGRCVTEMALTQAAEWALADVPFIKIAINVTAADFVLGNFPQMLKERLAHHGLDSSQIAVEVTEGMFLGRTAEAVLRGLHVLNEMGIEISFDDFGTGYASLMHLKLPIQRLKIDRSFVHGIEEDTANAAIVRAVTDLGHRLGKNVTVEGVETRTQTRLLHALGCRQYQGNFFSEPLPPEAVPAFIEKFNNQGLKGLDPVFAASQL